MNRLQHPEAVAGSPDEALVDERGDVSRPAAATSSAASRVQPPQEHRQPAQASVRRPTARTTTRPSRGASAGEDLRRAPPQQIEPSDSRSRSCSGEMTTSRRGELESERQVVEPRTAARPLRSREAGVDARARARNRANAVLLDERWNRIHLLGLAAVAARGSSRADGGWGTPPGRRELQALRPACARSCPAAGARAVADAPRAPLRGEACAAVSSTRAGSPKGARGTQKTPSGKRPAAPRPR